MLAKNEPIPKRRFGLIVDVSPTILRVLRDEPCPIHGQEFTLILKLEGDKPSNGCLECAIDLLKALSETVDEHNNAQAASGG